MTQTYRISAWVAFDIQAGTKEQARERLIKALIEGNPCDYDGYKAHDMSFIEDDKTACITDVSAEYEAAREDEVREAFEYAMHEKLESLPSLYV